MKKKYTYVQFYTLGICLFFFIFYFNLRNYGLPYFVNFDETAHIKSINYFYGMVLKNEKNLKLKIYITCLKKPKKKKYNLDIFNYDRICKMITKFYMEI